VVAVTSRRRAAGAAALGLLALLTSGCTTSANPERDVVSQPSTPKAAIAIPKLAIPKLAIPKLAIPKLAIPKLAITAPEPTSQYTLVQYPGAGFGGFYRQTLSARKTIDMELYELADTTEESDLAAAAARGIAVRVLLDSAYSGKRINAAAYGYLSHHGVQVKWAPSAYIFHIKTTTFDDQTSDVSTANLTSRYYADTRDAEVIDMNPAQVAAIEATFSADWTGTRPKPDTVQAAGLVWSPDTGPGPAQDAMVSQINAARRSVYLTSEELSDAPVYDALAAAARRGVRCEIVMTDSSEWHTGFTTVTAAGCQVRVYPDSSKALYIHEKIVLDDARTANQTLLIGSQNAGFDSLNRNRELSLLLTNSEAAAVINLAAGTFAADYAGAREWS
jgi:cardiolipin synthase